MTIKVEKISIDEVRNNSHVFREFCLAVKALKVGESFLYKAGAQHRVALSVFQIALDRKYATQSEGGKGMYRVGRVS